MKVILPILTQKSKATELLTQQIEKSFKANYQAFIKMISNFIEIIDNFMILKQFFDEFSKEFQFFKYEKMFSYEIKPSINFEEMKKVLINLLNLYHARFKITHKVII